MKLADLSWPALQALRPHTPVLVPIAAVEQHGHHLPVATDSMLLGEIVRRVEERLREQILVAPLLWLGNSEHHLDFCGTLTAAPRHYLDVLNDLAENLITHGFRRIIFINGHGGNDVPGRQALFEVRQRHRTREDLLLLFATYWSLGAKPWEKNPSLFQREMGHACEWETSMILRIAPHLVNEHTSLPPISAANAFDPVFRAWITRDRSTPGYIGCPHLATAEKGESLFQSFTDQAVDFLQKVLQWDGRPWNFA